MDFCDHYSRHFVGQEFNSVDHAHHYLTGLTGTQRRKNIETIENDVSGGDYQGMEQSKQRHKESHPLLSYRDITELLDFYLPRRHREEDEVHLQIHKRHVQRQKDIDLRRDRKTGIPPDCHFN